MAYQTDDLIWRVDKTFLGPPGKTLPFPVRHTAIGIGAAVLTVTFIVWRGILHAPLSFNMLLTLIAITVVGTARLMRRVDNDTSLSSIVQAASNDLVAPRPAKSGSPIALRRTPSDRLSHTYPSSRPARSRAGHRSRRQA